MTCHFPIRTCYLLRPQDDPFFGLRPRPCLPTKLRPMARSRSANAAGRAASGRGVAHRDARRDRRGARQDRRARKPDRRVAREVAEVCRDLPTGLAGSAPGWTPWRKGVGEVLQGGARQVQTAVERGPSGCCRAAGVVTSASGRCCMRRKKGERSAEDPGGERSAARAPFPCLMRSERVHEVDDNVAFCYVSGASE